MLQLITSEGEAQSQQSCSFEPILQVPDIFGVAKSPIANVFALTTNARRVYIWDAETDSIMATFDSGTGSRFPVWSGNGDLIATHSADAVYLWNAKSGQLLYTFAGHPVDIVDEIFRETASGASEKLFSSDGTMLVTAHIFDRTVLVYDTETGEVLYELGGHSDGVQTLDFSPDGSILATASSWSDVVTLWNMQTGQRLGELSGTAERITFSSDGSMLATGSNIIDGVASLESSIVSIWNYENGEKLTEFEAPLVITDLRWMLNNDVIFAEFSSHTLPSETGPFIGAALRAWRVSTGEMEYVFEASPDEISAFAWSTDEQILTIGTNSGLATVWDLGTGNSICSFEAADGVYQLFWLDGINGFISLTRDSMVTVWMGS
jgi:WD40 repeat protein